MSLGFCAVKIVFSVPKGMYCTYKFDLTKVKKLEESKNDPICPYKCWLW